jgi:hypothetical protein
MNDHEINVGGTMALFGFQFPGTSSGMAVAGQDIDSVSVGRADSVASEQGQEFDSGERRRPRADYCAVARARLRKLGRHRAPQG